MTRFRAILLFGFVSFLIYLPHMLNFGIFVGDSDRMNHSLSILQIYIDSFKAMLFPLWSDLMFGGFSLVSIPFQFPNPVALLGALFDVNQIYLFAGYEAFILLALSGWFTYEFLIMSKRSVLASIVGGVMYATCNLTLLKNGQNDMSVVAIVLTPLLLLMIKRIFNKITFFNYICIAFICFFLLSFSFIQKVSYIGLLAIAYSLWLWRGRHNSRALIICTCAALFSLLASLPRLITMGNDFQDGARSLHGLMNHHVPFGQRLPLYEVLRWFDGRIFGSSWTEMFALGNGVNLSEGFLLFMGFFPAIFIIYALLTLLPWRLKDEDGKFALIVLIFCFVVIFTPWGYEFIFRLFGGITFIHYRIILITLLPACLLATLVLDNLKDPVYCGEKILKRLSAFQLPTFNLEPKVFFLVILCLTILKIIFSFWLPFQLIPAPHDDYLFFRLAENIANLKWLGVFEQTTLVKGFTYPFFLSLSIFFKIPLRILESLLICSSALYFLVAIYRDFPNKTILALIYGVIIFYPFQYSLISFRLLRDMIYLPLLLLIISSLYLMYLDQLDQAVKKSRGWIHPIIFGLALFFFWNTREEGIWIMPVIGLWICILFWHSFKIHNVRNLFKKFFIAISVICALQGILLGLNAYKYRAIVVTIFKESNFKRGFSALYRIDSPKLWNEDISQDDWKILFQISPAAAELIPFVTGKTYRFWADITCSSIAELGYGAIELTACPNTLPPGNVAFALMDGLFEIGYRNPAQISEFMGRMANEIEDACKSKKVACISPPPFMLSRNIFEYGIPWHILIKNLKRSLYITATPVPISLNQFTSYYDLNSVPYMRTQLGGKLFHSQLQLELTSHEVKVHEEAQRNFVSKFRLLNIVFNWSSAAYSFFIHWAWILFLPLIWLVFRKWSAIFCIILALLGLVISRASLLSLLDFYAVAPVSALYLASGTYALFIAELLVCGFYGQLLINRLKKGDS